MILVITISTFVCIMLGVLGVYWLAFRPASAATERLKRTRPATRPSGSKTGLYRERGQSR